MSKETGKLGLINNFVRWTIIVCAATIIVTLVIIWILWMTLYKSTIDEALKFFSDKTIVQGYGINFNFFILSIITLLIIIFSFLFALPLVFYCKKTGFMILISLFIFILAAIILVTAILFVITSYNYYSDFYQVFGINKTLIVFLPWIIVVLFDLFLIFTGLWNLISTVNGVNLVPDVETEAKSLTEEKWEKPVSIEEKVITPVEQIIVPQKASSVPSIEETKINEKSENSYNNIETKTQEEMKVEVKEEEKNIVSTSQFGPFTVYREKEQAAIDSQAEKFENNEKLIPEEVKADNPITPSIAEHKKEKVKPITNWTKEQINEVWEKAQIINDVNPKLYRKDYAGAWMFKEAFTNTLAEVSVRSYAWTIVNHCPLSQGGDNSIANLDPMNVTNAITKGEDYPKWKTKISSSGNENILKEQTWKARI